MSDPASPLPASNSSVSPPNSELGTSNTSGHPSPPKKSKTPGPRHQAVLDTQCPKKCSERLFKAIMASLENSDHKKECEDKRTFIAENLYRAYENPEAYVELATSVITINHLKSCFDKEATPLVRSPQVINYAVENKVLVHKFGPDWFSSDDETASDVWGPYVDVTRNYHAQKSTNSEAVPDLPELPHESDIAKAVKATIGVLDAADAKATVEYLTTGLTDHLHGPITTSAYVSARASHSGITLSDDQQQSIVNSLNAVVNTCFDFVSNGAIPSSE